MNSKGELVMEENYDEFTGHVMTENERLFYERRIKSVINETEEEVSLEGLTYTEKAAILFPDEEGEEEVKKSIIAMLKEHFSSNKLMAKELKLYKALCETYDLGPHTAEKLVFEIRRNHKELDKKQLFKEQSSLLKKINLKLFVKLSPLNWLSSAIVIY